MFDLSIFSKSMNCSISHSIPFLYCFEGPDSKFRPFLCSRVTVYRSLLFHNWTTIRFHDIIILSLSEHWLDNGTETAYPSDALFALSDERLSTPTSRMISSLAADSNEYQPVSSRLSLRFAIAFAFSWPFDSCNSLDFFPDIPRPSTNLCSTDRKSVSRVHFLISSPASIE